MSSTHEKELGSINALIAKLEALANVWNDPGKDYVPYTDDREDGEITGKQMCAEELRKIIQEAKQ